MTIFFKNSEIQIYRKRRKGNTDRWGMSATFTAHQADIQPETRPERLEMAQGRFGAVFTAFVDTDADIKEGDQLVASGKRYSVKGVSRFQGAGLLDHIELTLVALDG